MPTVADLGARVKAKYPGPYDHLSDADLGTRVKAKYPGAYDQFIDIPAGSEQTGLPGIPAPALPRQLVTDAKIAVAGAFVDSNILGKRPAAAPGIQWTPMPVKPHEGRPPGDNAAPLPVLGAAVQGAEPITRGVVRGASSGTLGTAGGLTQWLGNATGSQTLSGAGSVLSDANQAVQEGLGKPELDKDPLDDPRVLADPNWYLYQLGNGLGQIAPALATGSLTGKALVKLVEAGKVAPQLAQQIVRWGSVGSAALQAGLQEGASVYDEALRETGDHTEAQKRAAITAAVSAGTSLASFRLGMMNDRLGNRWLRGGVSSGLESAQELTENTTENAVAGRPLEQGAATAAIAGAMTGKVAGVAHGGTQTVQPQPQADTGRAKLTDIAEVLPAEEAPAAPAPAPRPRAGYQQAVELAKAAEGKITAETLARELGVKPGVARNYLARMEAEGVFTQPTPEKSAPEGTPVSPPAATTEAAATEPAAAVVQPVSEVADTTQQTQQAETPQVVEAPSQQEPEPPQVRALGRRVRVKTARGSVVDVDYAVVDANDLNVSHDTGLNENPRYPQELQPRDRSRKASEAQIAGIAAQLDPEELGESYKASHGAPIVGDDLVVESGNGRSIALQRLYDADHANARAYGDWVRNNAERFGLDPEAVRGVERPVLVRVRRSPVDRVQFAKEANERDTATMSASEQAVSDASRISGELMDLFAPSEDGDLTAAGNREFVRGFLRAATSDAERGEYMTSDGSLSQAGITRMRNAVFARAYGDSAVLETMAESTDSNIRNVTNGMLQAAPSMVRLRAGVESGDLHPVDLGPDIAAAAAKLSSLKEQGQSVADYRAQIALFGDELSPESKDLLDVFSRWGRSPKKIASLLRNYAELAEAAGSPKQTSMFGDVAPPTKAELLTVAAERAEQESAGNGRADTGQGALLLEGQGAPGDAREAARPATQAAAAGADGTAVIRKTRKRPLGSERGEIAPDLLIPNALLPRPGDKQPRVQPGQTFGESFLDMLRPAGRRVERSGPHGKAIMAAIDRANDEGEVRAGGRIERLEAAGLGKLKPAERTQLVDVLQGRLQRADAPEAVQRAAQVVQEITGEMADEAEANGVMVRDEITIGPGDPRPPDLTLQQIARLDAGRRVRKSVVRPFRRRANYYPHVMPRASQLRDIQIGGLTKRSRVRHDIITNLVRMGVRPDEKSATAFLNAYVEFLEGTRVAPSLVKHLIDTGQAKDKAEAVSKLLRFRESLVKRQGSLEYARQVDLPFWDPDPARVLPFFVRSGSVRLSQIEELGQENEVVNELMTKLERARGQQDARAVRAVVDEILEMVNEPDNKQARVLRALRTAQGFKLGLAQITNMPQGVLNSLLYGDAVSTLKGARAALTKEGKRFGVRSGAALDSALGDILSASQEGPLSRFLRDIGFTAT